MSATATPAVPLTDRQQAVLLAASYAEARWNDPTTDDIAGQLAAPRLYSGAGVLPMSLSQKELVTTLAALRGLGLVVREPALGRRGRRVVLTPAGRAEVATLDNA
jgi:hypothetical protein